MAVSKPSEPLRLVRANTRYQRGAMVRELAHELGIELSFLPAYSPNLSLIERRWKLVQKEWRSCRCVEDFAGFKTAIVECLDGVEGTHRTSAESLLRLNFQNLENPQLLARQNILNRRS